MLGRIFSLAAMFLPCWGTTCICHVMSLGPVHRWAELFPTDLRVLILPTDPCIWIPWMVVHFVGRINLDLTSHTQAVSIWRDLSALAEKFPISHATGPRVFALNLIVSITGGRSYTLGKNHPPPQSLQGYPKPCKLDVFYEPIVTDHGYLRNQIKSCVVPCPTGWLSTLSTTGVLNSTRITHLRTSQFQTVTNDS